MARTKVFLSYRRDDLVVYGISGRIYDDLAKRFGERYVFMDQENISGGEDFKTVIREWIKSSNKFLVLIGPQWIESFQTRPSDSEDYVRFEIKEALSNGVPVIPVLIGSSRCQIKMSSRMT